MSKASKSRARERRAQAKRSRKMANRALYQSWAKAGENSKSFRHRKRVKKHKTNTTKGVHHHYCGNIACTQCFERTDTNFIQLRKSA